MMMVIIFFVIIYAFSPCCASTAILRVPDQYQSIASALIYASDGATIMLTSNFYQSDGNCGLLITKSISIVSATGMPQLINCGGRSRIMEINGRGFSNDWVQVRIDNLHFYSGNANINQDSTNYGGGGIKVRYATLNMTNVIFEKCLAVLGGAIHAQFSNLTIDNSKFIFNSIVTSSADAAAAAIFYECGDWSYISNSVFVGNSYYYYGSQSGQEHATLVEINNSSYAWFYNNSIEGTTGISSGSIIATMSIQFVSKAELHQISLFNNSFHVTLDGYAQASGIACYYTGLNMSDISAIANSIQVSRKAQVLGSVLVVSNCAYSNVWNLYIARTYVKGALGVNMGAVAIRYSNISASNFTIEQNVFETVGGPVLSPALLISAASGEFSNLNVHDNSAFFSNTSLGSAYYGIVDNTTVCTNHPYSNGTGACTDDSAFKIRDICGSISIRPYTSNLDVIWYVSPPDYSDRRLSFLVALTVFGIELESDCQYDSLQIFDGPSTASPLIGRYCGGDTPICSAGTCPAGNNLFQTQGDALTVRFTSDSTTSSDGFNITFKTVPQLNIIDTSSAKRTPALFIETLKGIIGGGIQISDSKNVVLKSCNVARNHIQHPYRAVGGGISVLRSAVKIMDTIAASNTINGFLAGGGGISIIKSTVILQNCTLQANRVIGSDECLMSGGNVLCPTVFGGALMALLSTVTILKSNLIDNHAICSQNLDSCKASGGGISIALSSTLDLNDTTVTRSSALSGGGFFVSYNSSISARNFQCSWNTCNCTDTGLCNGGCFLGNSGDIFISNGDVMHNTAAGGGGCDFEGIAVVKVENTRFSGNLATVGGGAVRVAGSALVTLQKQSSMKENTANLIGGGILGTENSRLKLSEISMENNTAKHGAILWGDGGEILIEIEKSKLMSGLGSMALVVGSIKFLNGNNSVNWTCTYVGAVMPLSRGDSYYALDCSVCEKGTYSLSTNVLSLVNTSCQACPFGGNCVGGSANSTGLLALPGFWGKESSLVPLTVEFVLCPSGYCCSVYDKSCAFDYCGGYRVGILCGKCPVGYGYAFFTDSCMPDEKCHSYQWAFVMIMVVGGVIAMYLVYCKGRGSMGLDMVLLFFYQSLPLVKSTPWKDTLPGVISFLQSVFSVAPKGSLADGLCLFPSMTAATKQGSMLIVLFSVLIAILLLNIIHNVIHHIICHKFGRFHWLHRYPASLEQYVGAVVNFLSVSFTTVALTTMQNIQCVEIDGNSVWWLDAEIVCYRTWQIISLVFMLILAPLPLAVAIMQRRWNASRLLDPWKSEIYMALADGFRYECNWWLSVSWYRRLFLVLAFTVITDLAWKAIMMAILCCVFLIANLFFLPFENREVNHAETVALVCLFLLAVSSSPQLAQIEFGSINAISKEMLLELLQLITALLPGLVCACIAAKWVGLEAKKYFHSRSLVKSSKFEYISTGAVAAEKKHKAMEAWQNQMPVCTTCGDHVETLELVCDDIDAGVCC